LLLLIVMLGTYIDGLELRRKLLMSQCNPAAFRECGLHYLLLIMNPSPSIDIIAELFLSCIVIVNLQARC
jgi:hypothetical protein